MQLISTKYKTRDGAQKRAAFENAIALSEFKRGDKTRLYTFRAVEHNGLWRVAKQPQATRTI